MKYTPHKLLFFLALVIFGSGGCSQTDRYGQGIPQDYKESTKWLRRQLIKAVPTPNVSWGFHVLRGQGVTCPHERVHPLS